MIANEVSTESIIKVRISRRACAELTLLHAQHRQLRKAAQADGDGAAELIGAEPPDGACSGLVKFYEAPNLSPPSRHAQRSQHTVAARSRAAVVEAEVAVIHGEAGSRALPATLDRPSSTVRGVVEVAERLARRVLLPADEWPAAAVHRRLLAAVLDPDSAGAVRAGETVLQ